jgi:hypothetical protein
VPAGGTQTIVHHLGRTPKGIAVERCDLGGPITLTARTDDTITLTNADPANVANCVVRVY